eukprot:10310921-Alexandrium_andersonii.AAC.1
MATPCRGGDRSARPTKSTMVVTIYWGLFNLSPVLNLLACIGIASCETVMQAPQRYFVRLDGRRT